MWRWKGKGIKVSERRPTGREEKLWEGEEWERDWMRAMEEWYKNKVKMLRKSKWNKAVWIKWSWRAREIRMKGEGGDKADRLSVVGASILSLNRRRMYWKENKSYDSLWLMVSAVYSTFEGSTHKQTSTHTHTHTHTHTWHAQTLLAFTLSCFTPTDMLGLEILSCVCCVLGSLQWCYPVWIKGKSLPVWRIQLRCCCIHTQ